MRQSCGSNEHPDSVLFIQMYKLISTYSLIKPPKGCNVTGGEMVEALLKLKDITDHKKRWTLWSEKIDSIVDSGLQTHEIEAAHSVIQDHSSYFDCNTSDFALAYISGYVARKSHRFLHFSDGTCENCMASLILKDNVSIPASHKFIQLKSKGFLTHPSVELFNLISVLEEVTLETLKKNYIGADFIFNITEELAKKHLPFVGCDTHKRDLVRRIVTFYLTMRMFFIVKQCNKNDCIEKEVTREKRKLSKLATESPSTKTATQKVSKKRAGSSIKKSSKKPRLISKSTTASLATAASQTATSQKRPGTADNLTPKKPRVVSELATTPLTTAASRTKTSQKRPLQDAGTAVNLNSKKPRL